jgi:hypothetical protein
MSELILMADEVFPRKAVLTLQEVADFLQCEPRIIQNWTRRADAKRRPPRITVGKELRFPKREFLSWLAQDQGLNTKAP